MYQAVHDFVQTNHATGGAVRTYRYGTGTIRHCQSRCAEARGDDTPATPQRRPPRIIIIISSLPTTTTKGSYVPIDVDNSSITSMDTITPNGSTICRDPLAPAKPSLPRNLKASQHDDIFLEIAKCIDFFDAHRAPRGESLVSITCDMLYFFFSSSNAPLTNHSSMFLFVLVDRTNGPSSRNDSFLQKESCSKSPAMSIASRRHASRL